LLTANRYLKSPIVELVVGRGDARTVLSAHEALLEQSPFLKEQCAKLRAKGPATSSSARSRASGGGQPSSASQQRRVDLADEDAAAVGSALEYLYNGDYFPRYAAGSARELEPDPSVPSPDADGAGLLRHARVYTLAGRLGLPALRALAHGKIHATRSTARGEMAYARYVYGSTAADDDTIRRPVAAFWASRSHVLRHEADDEFRGLCLEHPRFGFDVLSLVLDAREKKGSGGGGGGPVVDLGGAAAAPSSARKRLRHA
jgi:hypothetical protein